MVQGIPYIRIKTSSEAAYSEPDHNYLWATVVESTRGPVNKPVFIESKMHAKQLFGINVDPFFDNGGQGLVMIRAAQSGQYKYVEDGETDFAKNADGTYKLKAFEPTVGTLDLTADITYTKVVKKGEGETATLEPTAQDPLTKTPVIRLTANNVGSEPINVTFSLYARGGYSIRIATASYNPVNIQGCKTLAELVEKINKRSYSLTAKLTDNGILFDKLVSNNVSKATPYTEGQITEFSVASINTGAFSFAGTNGIWDAKTNRIPDENITDTNGVTIADVSYYGAKAHRAALTQLENVRLAGIFCLYPESDIQNEYAYHSEKMSTEDVCRWRYAVVGANDDDRRDIGDLIDRAVTLDSQYIIFIGQGAYNYDEEYIPAYCMTQYWAGMRSKLNYGSSMFGGENSKVIYGWSETEDKNKPLYNIAPLLVTDTVAGFEPETYVTLNEAGVVTLKREYGTVTFREGVTTSQDNDYTSEESVVNIVKYALNVTYDECYKYQGKNITTSLKGSLEEAIKTKLNDMKTFDQTLTDVESDSLKAYDVEVIITPRANQKIGRIYVNMKITPVYALRQVEASVIVQ
jgi:hypothetical protein